MKANIIIEVIYVDLDELEDAIDPLDLLPHSSVIKPYITLKWKV